MKSAFVFAVAALLASTPAFAMHDEVIHWVDAEGVQRFHIVHVPDKYDHVVRRNHKLPPEA